MLAYLLVAVSLVVKSTQLRELSGHDSSAVVKPQDVNSLNHLTMMIVVVSIVAVPFEV